MEKYIAENGICRLIKQYQETTLEDIFEILYNSVFKDKIKHVYVIVVSKKIILTFHLNIINNINTNSYIIEHNTKTNEIYIICNDYLLNDKQNICEHLIFILKPYPIDSFYLSTTVYHNGSYKYKNIKKIFNEKMSKELVYVFNSNYIQSTMYMTKIYNKNVLNYHVI
jgi:hypothetical protein